MKREENRWSVDFWEEFVQEMELLADECGMKDIGEFIITAVIEKVVAMRFLDGNEPESSSDCAYCQYAGIGFP